MHDFDFEVIEDTICTALPAHRGTCHKVAAALEPEIERMIEQAIERDRRERDNAISWNTTCFNCSKLLDESYSEYVKGYKAALRDNGIKDKEDT